jgi:hypothetical protein
MSLDAKLRIVWAALAVCGALLAWVIDWRNIVALQDTPQLLRLFLVR